MSAARPQPKAKPKPRAKKPKAAADRMGKVQQLYDVRVIDEQGEIIDERCINCSCYLFAWWWQGNLHDSQDRPYPDSVTILVNPR